MSDRSVHGVVDRATDSDAFEYLARAGFAISGVLHLIVAFIVLRIAFGSGGNADQSGALATLAKQPGGTLMLWTAAIGMAALALWHVAEAIVGKHPGERSRSQQDREDRPAWKRAKDIGVAILYFAIALSAARFAMGSGQSSGQQNSGMSAQLMQSGWGKTLLIAVGLGVAAVGGYHVYKGASTKFLKDLRVSGGTGITAVGITGYVAKGLVLDRCRAARHLRFADDGPVEGGRPRCGGQDARPGAVRQVPADPGRTRTRRVRRLQLRAQSLRPDVATFRLHSYWNDSTSAASCPGDTETPHWPRRSVSGWAMPFKSRNSPGCDMKYAWTVCLASPVGCEPAAVSTSSAPGWAAR